MSEEDPLVDGVPLSSLKVVDLRAELKKRGLSANGNKNVLADRLRTFINTGAAEYSDASSTQSSPVKSPNSSSSLIAQYRASQQQMLAAVGRHDSSENGVENGHTSPQKSPTKSASPIKSPEKAASPVKSPEKAASPVKSPAKPPAEEPSPSPKKAKSPEPAAEPPAKKSKKSEPSPEKAKDVPKSKVQDSEVPGISQERGISKEPSEEPERSREPSANVVSGAENDESSGDNTPARSKSPPRPAKQTSNGSVFAPAAEPTEELDYEEESTTVKTKKPEVYTEGVVYVKSPERPKPAKPEEDPLTEDGFVRRREVTPAKNPESVFIHIRNLKRPFTLGSLQNVLKKFGEFDVEKEFWIDSIRSHCFVKYASVEEASKARAALHYIEWPPGNKTEITADYSNEEEFDHFRGVIKKVVRTESVDDESSRSTTKQEEAPSPRVREEKADREKRREEKKSIEQLFRKTKAEPAIYYLPLTEEEAARNQARKAIERRRASPPPKANSPVRRRLSRSVSRSRSPDRRRVRRDSPPPRRRSPPRRPFSPRRRSPSRDSAPRRRRSPPRRSPRRS